MYSTTEFLINQIQMRIFSTNTLKAISKLATFVCILFYTLPAIGQVGMSTSGTYTQTFNTLNTSGSPVWTDNTTLANWYAQRTGTGTTIVADAGTNTGGNLYSYGTGTTTERALGSIGSGNAAAG